MSNEILIIGSSGFLGRTILKTLFESTAHPNSVYRLVRTNNQIFVSPHPNERNSQITLEEFVFGSDKEIQIINCASSRYSRSNRESKQANYWMPKEILDITTESYRKKITWIQPESFWQYTLDTTPDSEYVYWKNRFGNELDEVLKTFKHFDCARIVLPHLFGVNDTYSRFIPKLFKSLLCEDLVYVNGREDDFVVADIADVANYCLHLLEKNTITPNGNVVLFPYHEITLGNLVNKFLDGRGISPKIIWNKSSTSLNPSMNLKLDFSGVPANTVLTPLENSLINIGSWLIHEINEASSTLP